MKTFTMHDLSLQILELQNEVERLTEDHKKLGQLKVNKEKQYRMELSKELTIATSQEKLSITLANDVVRGRENVAAAKEQWSLAENMQDSTQQAIYAAKGRINIYMEFIKWDRGE